jgi:pimeloyl-ACP methyl ester carboxylesterase
VLQDVSFTAEARMIAEVIDALGIERIDLIGNDSGGAVVFPTASRCRCSAATPIRAF